MIVRLTVNSPLQGMTFSKLTIDGYVLFGTRVLRMFAYGFLSVVLVLYLAQLGLSEGLIGLLLSLTLFGDAVISLWMTTTADRVGRRRILIAGAALMLFAGLAAIDSRNNRRNQSKRVRGWAVPASRASCAITNRSRRATYANLCLVQLSWFIRNRSRRPYRRKPDTASAANWSKPRKQLPRDSSCLRVNWCAPGPTLYSIIALGRGGASGRSAPTEPPRLASL